MTKLLGALAFHLLLLTFAALFYLNVRGMPAAANVLPIGIIIVFTILVLANAVQEVRGSRMLSRESASQGADSLSSSKAEASGLNGLRLIATLGVTFLYVILGWRVVGFYPSTAAYLLVLSAIMGERRVLRMFGGMAIVVAGCMAVFEYGFGLELP